MILLQWGDILGIYIGNLTMKRRLVGLLIFFISLEFVFVFIPKKEVKVVKAANFIQESTVSPKARPQIVVILQQPQEIIPTRRYAAEDLNPVINNQNLNLHQSSGCDFLEFEFSN